jgi:transcriptional regulator of acetoin/glycerol metabolism
MAELATHLLASLELEEPCTLTSEAIQALALHSWPGNVRELRAVLLRAAATSSRTRLDAEDIVHATGRSFGQDAPLGPDPIRVALIATHGNVSAAARLLGIPRSTFRGRMESRAQAPLN